MLSTSLVANPFCNKRTEKEWRENVGEREGGRGKGESK